MRFRFGPFELDDQCFELRREGRVLELEPKVFDLLVYLLRHRDRVVSKDELIGELWEHRAVSESVLTRCISLARRALDDAGEKQQIIQTHYGRGYRFIAPVSEAGWAASAKETRSETAAAPAHAVESLEAGTNAASKAQRASHGPFVGRERELAALAEHLQSLHGGYGGFLLLLGEAGIGKSRLLEEFASRAREQNDEVHFGRCDEDEGAPPYWPWIQSVRSLASRWRTDELRSLLGGGAAEIAQIIPELKELFPDLSEPAPLVAEQARFRFFDNLAQFLTRAARVRPLVLMLDDLHRADQPSLLLLRFLVRELCKEPVLIVAAGRDAELRADSSRAQIVSELTRVSEASSLTLQGFSQMEVGSYVVATTGTAIGRAAMESLHQRTAGNPFFLSQMVQILEQEGNLKSPLAVMGSASLPEGVRDAINLQLGGLSETARGLLSVAAVIGRDFALPALAAVADQDPKAALVALEPALKARVIQEASDTLGRYRFTHVLVRDALYEALEPSRRASLHRKVGEVLDRLYDSEFEPRLAEIAYHFLQAVPIGEPARAVEFSARAARWASEHLAYEESVHHYRNALHVLSGFKSSDEEHCDLLLALAEAEIRAGLRNEGKASFQKAAVLARRLNTPERLARAALGIAPGFFALEGGVYDPLVVDLLDSALALLSEKQSELKVMVMARLSLALIWSNEGKRRLALIEEAFREANKINRPNLIADVLGYWLVVRWGIESARVRSEVAGYVDKILSGAGRLEGLAVIRVFRIVSLMEEGKFNEADQVISAFERLTLVLKQPQSMWYAVLYRSVQMLLRGEYAEAENLANKFLEIGNRVDDKNAAHSYTVCMFLIRWREARLESVLPFAQQAANLFTNFTVGKACLAWLYAMLEEKEQARGLFNEIVCDGVATIEPRVEYKLTIGMLSEVCVLLGDRERAKEFYEAMLPYAQEHITAGIVGYWGTTARFLGILASLLGDVDLAIEHLGYAVSESKRIGARPWAVQAQCDYARTLLVRDKQGDKDLAYEMLQEALETAQAIMFKPFVQECIRIAREHSLALSEAQGRAV